MLNRNGGPSASAVFDSVTRTVPPALATRYGHEVAEPIGQEVLPLGDRPDAAGLTRAKIRQEARAWRDDPQRPLCRVEDQPASASVEDVPPRVEENCAVPIEVRPIPGRGGRPRNQEHYPFDTMNISMDSDGRMEGESFFIPEADHPERRLACARKRYQGKGFSSRKEVGGTRVWRYR